MKKLYGIGAILAGAVLLTGCGGSNKYTCSLSYSEGDESMTQKIVTYLDKNDKVESYDIVYELSKKETADLLYSMYSQVEGIDVSQSGKTITIKNGQNINESQIDIIGKTKEEVKEYITSQEPDATCK